MDDDAALHVLDKEGIRVRLARNRRGQPWMLPNAEETAEATDTLHKQDQAVRIASVAQGSPPAIDLSSHPTCSNLATAAGCAATTPETVLAQSNQETPHRATGSADPSADAVVAASTADPPPRTAERGAASTTVEWAVSRVSQSSARALPPPRASPHWRRPPRLLAVRAPL